MCRQQWEGNAPPTSPVTEDFWAGCMGTGACVSDILTDSDLGGPRSTTGLSSRPAAHSRSCTAKAGLMPSALHRRSWPCNHRWLYWQKQPDNGQHSSQPRDVNTMVKRVLLSID